MHHKHDNFLLDPELDGLAIPESRWTLPRLKTTAWSPQGSLDSPDPDQLLSQQLLSTEPELPLASSAPGAVFAPSLSAMVTASFQTEISQSPAAMFLSAFSPPVGSAPANLDGQVVGGYTLGPIIGHGGFSTIRRASSSSGSHVAVKIVRRADISKQPNPAQARRRLDHEADMWASLSHEHILPLFSTERTASADFFITLLCPAGSLFDILQRDGTPALPQDDSGMMFRQVVRGLRYMHEVAGLVHRDLKLENVLVDEMGVCKIADFGMTRLIGEPDDEDDEDEERQTDATTSLSRRSNRIGLTSHLSMIRPRGKQRQQSTPFPSSSRSPAPHLRGVLPGSLPYASPELLSPNALSQLPVGPQPSQDIWALGVMLYTMLTGRLPFADSFEPRLMMKILHGAFTMPPDIGLGAERVLQGCLTRPVEDRWTIAMVDELAWGVGWGSAGDKAAESPTVSDELAARRRSRSREFHLGHSRSRSAGRSLSRSQRPCPEPDRSLERVRVLATLRPPPMSPALSNSSTASSSSVVTDLMGPLSPPPPPDQDQDATPVVAAPESAALLHRGRPRAKIARSPSPGSSASPGPHVHVRAPADVEKAERGAGAKVFRGGLGRTRFGSGAGMKSPAVGDVLEEEDEADAAGDADADAWSAAEGSRGRMGRVAFERGSDLNAGRAWTQGARAAARKGQGTRRPGSMPPAPYAFSSPFSISPAGGVAPRLSAVHAAADLSPVTTLVDALSLGPGPTLGARPSGADADARGRSMAAAKLSPRSKSVGLELGRRGRC